MQPLSIKNTVSSTLTGRKGKLLWRLLPKIAKTNTGRSIFYLVTRFTIERYSTVKVSQTDFKLSDPNPRLAWRNRTFAKKEPDTLRWIESFAHGAILWDIGANIGLYSIYAAKVRNCKVLAFEPSVFCLEFLARNIWLNQLHEQVTIVPNPLCDTSRANILTLNSRDWGESSNSFGTTLDQDGQEIEASFEYKILGTTIDESISKLNLPAPQHIKIDVDGIEPLILVGGVQTLKQVESVSVEVPTYRGANEQVSELLTQAGLKLVLDSGNQIWRRA
jgi:FkbM family methyltransferase